MDIAGTINQHGKITISLRIGNVATLKGELDETGTDTAGIVCTTDPLSSDGGRQQCGRDKGKLGEEIRCNGAA